MERIDPDNYMIPLWFLTDINARKTDYVFCNHDSCVDSIIIDIQKMIPKEEQPVIHLLFLPSSSTKKVDIFSPIFDIVFNSVLKNNIPLEVQDDPSRGLGGVVLITKHTLCIMSKIKHKFWVQEENRFLKEAEAGFPSFFTHKEPEMGMCFRSIDFNSRVQ